MSHDLAIGRVSGPKAIRTGKGDEKDAEYWKQKYLTLEGNYKHEVDQIRHIYQDNLAKHENEWAAKHGKDKVFLEGELSKFKKMYLAGEGKAGQLASDNQKLREIVSELERSAGLSKEDRIKFMSLQDRIAILISENEKLRELLQNSRDEVESFMEKYRRASENLTRAQRELTDRIEVLERERELLIKQLHDKAPADYKRIAEELELALKENNKLGLVVSEREGEIDRLYNDIKTRDLTISDLRNQLALAGNRIVLSFA